MIKLQTSTIIQRTMQATQQEFYEDLPQLETTIFEKTQKMMALVKKQDSSVLQSIALRKNPANGELTYPKFDKRACYYQQFWKIFLLNEILISQVKDFSSLNKTLTIEVNEIQELQSQWTRIQTSRNKKKVRRTADLIQKNYICPFEKCAKNYGTDVALNNHMKIKHNSGTKTQREMLAKQICMAEQRGELDKLQVYLTFPPNYLEHYKLHVYKPCKI